MKPKVGVSGILQDPSKKFLLGRRLNTDTQGGKWVTPGGGVEFLESLEDALKREFMEEVNLEIGIHLSFVSVQERLTDHNSHVVMVFKRVYCTDLSTLKSGSEFTQVGWFTWLEICAMESIGGITEMTFNAIRDMRNYDENQNTVNSHRPLTPPAKGSY